MKIEIRIGDTSTNKRVKYSHIKMDDVNKEIQQMYDFLICCTDCIIEDVDNFLLYALNNGLMTFIVKPDSAYDKNYNFIPKFNPSEYKVVEIKEDGTEVSIQEEDGFIGENYFNQLMNAIMDDYYESLNFYKYEY